MTEEDFSYRGTPKLNIEEYREYVDDLDLSEEAKVELLESLWSIMGFFVRRAFGEDSTEAPPPFPACEEALNEEGERDQP